MNKSYKRIGLALCLGIIALMQIGCAQTKQYSIDSYGGMLPMHDLQYVEQGQVPTL